MTRPVASQVPGGARPGSSPRTASQVSGSGTRASSAAAQPQPSRAAGRRRAWRGRTPPGWPPRVHRAAARPRPGAASRRRRARPTNHRRPRGAGCRRRGRASVPTPPPRRPSGRRPPSAAPSGRASARARHGRSSTSPRTTTEERATPGARIVIGHAPSATRARRASWWSTVSSVPGPRHGTTGGAEGGQPREPVVALDALHPGGQAAAGRAGRRRDRRPWTPPGCR